MPESAIPFLDAAAVRAATPWPALIDAIRDGFTSAHTAPDRHVHRLPVPGRAEATALLMPAWIEGEAYGVKLANIFPSNNDLGRPAVSSVYVLFDAMTGTPAALIDGGEITARRTAATSALAASRLARADARTLLLVGTGRLPSLLAEAHRAVRPIERILVWGRNGGKARELAQALERRMGIAAAAADDLDAAVAEADIVSTATISRAALVRGERLRPGTHLDLVGAFAPHMRETDAEAVRRATVFVDTEGGAMAEAGDLIRAAAEGAFAWPEIAADLAALCAGRHAGRQAEAEITLFKSVGAAIEDLVAARLTFAAWSGT